MKEQNDNSLPVFGTRVLVEQLRTEYPRGTRVELLYMDDPRSDMHNGLKGNVIFVDPTGTIHVAWDNGATLGIIPGIDKFRIIND